MKQSLDFKSIMDSINTNDREEKAAAFKMIKSFAKLPFSLRKTLMSTIIAVSENEEIKGRKVNLNELSFDIEMRPAPRGLVPSLIGVLLLLLSLAGAIVQLPCFLKLQEQSIFLIVIWKYLTMAAVFSPFMILDFATSDAFVLWVIKESLPSLIVLSMINTCYAFLFFLAATKTFIVHTLIFGFLCFPLLAVWKIARRLPYSRLEYIGIGIIIFGAYLCCCEGDVIPKHDLIVGDFCALAASLALTVYLAYSAPLLKTDGFPYYTYMVLSSLCIALFSWLLSWIFNKPVDLFSFEPDNGVFGLFADSYVALYGACGLGLMGGFAVNFGNSRAKDYISPMFVEVCVNFVPFLSQCMAFFMDLQGFPGIWTTYGGPTVFIGMILLSMNTQDQREMKQIPLIGRPEDDDPTTLVSEIDEILAK